MCFFFMAARHDKTRHSSSSSSSSLSVRRCVLRFVFACRRGFVTVLFVLSLFFEAGAISAIERSGF